MRLKWTIDFGLGIKPTQNPELMPKEHGKEPWFLISMSLCLSTDLAGYACICPGSPPFHTQTPPTAARRGTQGHAHHHAPPAAEADHRAAHLRGGPPHHLREVARPIVGDRVSKVSCTASRRP